MGGASRFISLLTTPSPFPFLLLRRTSLLRHSLAPLSTSTHHLNPSLSPRPQSRFRPAKASIHTQTTSTNQDDNRDSLGFLSPTSPSGAAAHPWPEWPGLVDSLSSAGYFGNQRREILVDDAFVADEKLSDEFVRVASACLAFAHDRSDILGLLSRRDISVVVETGTPFLFKSALDTTRRMRAFHGLGSSYEFDTNKARTVDLMKYLLSYASNPTVSSERSNLCTEGLIESAVRNLLSELTRLGCGISAPESSASVQHQFPDRYGQTPRPLGQNLEMKRGDWICPRCTFMNFARNAKCLKCEEARPKRQLTGGEWECPQCDFFNYGRNPLCIRCDCKRPVDASFGIADSSSVLGRGNGLYGNKPDIDGRLAANEEKAQRRLPNAQFQRDSANTGSSEILGRTSAVSDGDKNNVADGQNGETTSSPSLSRSTSPQFGHPKGRHSSYVPFVPLPKDMFAKNPEKIEENERMVTDTIHNASLEASEQTSTVSGSSASGKSVDSLHLTEQLSNEVEKSESWFKKVVDLHDGAELESDDFPDVMPMRKGENRFVVSKKNSRSLSSPMYKRKMAMEQTGSTTNFVPFVPFPPDYFAKRDNQQSHGADSTVKATGETSSDSDTDAMHKMDNPQTRREGLYSESSGENLDERKTRDTDGSPISGSPTHNSFNSQSSDKAGGWNNGFSGKDSRTENANLSSGENVNERKHIAYGSPIGGYPTQNSFDSLGSKQHGRTTGFSGNERRIESSDLSGSSTKQPESQSVRSGWTGKSLEGSAVQEPDPLDMSEEAKAQRWFRRVAQIKDISELSQIPDEDFPSIMPMRKGVNRFVVSKRKTPLERRLTSPQYRRNLPVVSSDPTKKENENS